MTTANVISGLRAALSELYLAGIDMPRHTPSPGGASTEHSYQLSGSAVWAHDMAMTKAAALLNITDLPSTCCVGNNGFDPVLAERVAASTRRVLAAST